MKFKKTLNEQKMFKPISFLLGYVNVNEADVTLKETWQF